MLRVGLVGAGTIGAKRALEVARSPLSRLVAIADQDQQRAQSLAAQHGCKTVRTWEELVRSPEIDGVIVATTHQWLAPITLAALQSYKHVMTEKPLAMHAGQAETLVESATRHHVKLKAGYNHRHHPAVQRAYALAQEGQIGRLLFIRCRYGHGGRAGYEREWRADPFQSGGGELLDQGVHALDLFRWFLGEFSEMHAVLTQSFWPIPVEDNAFCTLRTAGGCVAMLHASWTQWKNIFSFEVFGDRGYLLVEGLGGSYGREKLVIGRRPEQFGPPTEQVLEFSNEDYSWRDEWEEFVLAIQEDRRPLADGLDGFQVLRLVCAAYESARHNRVVQLGEPLEC